MNIGKITPLNKETCKCICCSDCFYYNKSISWENCPQRIQFYKNPEYRTKQIKLNKLDKKVDKHAKRIPFL